MITPPSVQFSRSVVSDSLWPHESQHARPPCPSPTPRVYSNSCPSSRWCHPAISSCHPLLLPPIPSSIRVFSNESTLRMRWTKYWSFSLSISPSNEHPGLISFRLSWLNLLAPNDTSGSLESINRQVENSKEISTWVCKQTHRSDQPLPPKDTLVQILSIKTAHYLTTFYYACSPPVSQRTAFILPDYNHLPTALNPWFLWYPLRQGVRCITVCHWHGPAFRSQSPPHAKKMYNTPLWWPVGPLPHCIPRKMDISYAMLFTLFNLTCWHQTIEFYYLSSL